MPYTFALVLTFFMVSCSQSTPEKYRMISSSGSLYFDGLEDEVAHDHEHGFCQHEEEELLIPGMVTAREPSSDVRPDPSRAIASASDLHYIAQDRNCSDVTREEIDNIVEAIHRFGGQAVDPMEYDETIDGFQRFLDDSGVISRFSAAEMVRPHRPQHARSCGHPNHLMPPRCRWLSGAVQGLLASKLRAEINNGNAHGSNAISVRNWWRPQCYNSRVGGAGASDHIQARGFDLDFATPQQRAVAQNYLCRLYKEERFNLQVGIGCQTLHVGIGSPKRIANYPSDGSRYWTYASINSCQVKRLSTDDCWVRDGRGMRYIHPTGFSPQGSTRGNL